MRETGLVRRRATQATLVSRELTLMLLLSGTALTACGGGGGGGGAPATTSPPPKDTSGSGPATTNTPEKDTSKTKPVTNPDAAPANSNPPETKTRPETETRNEEAQNPSPPSAPARLIVPALAVKKPDQPTEPTTGSITLSGRVFDGPVWGARVWLDINRDGVINGGDIKIAETGPMGRFTATLDAGREGTPLIVQLDEATDIGDPDIQGDERPMTGTWRGGGVSQSAGTHIISPMTELMARTGADSRRMADHFGIDTGRDLRRLDPYEPGLASDIKQAILTINRLINDVVLRLPDPMPTPGIPPRTDLVHVMLLSGDRSRVAEGVTPQDRKLADLTFSFIATGAHRPTLSEDSKAFFDLRLGSDGVWSLWLKGGVMLDYETVNPAGGTALAAIEARISTPPPGRGAAPLQQTYRLQVTDRDEAPTAMRVTNIHDPLPENTMVSRATRLATIEVDDPDRNPAFRNWDFVLSPEHARLFEVREVGGSLGLYFRSDTAPDFEMPGGWTIPVGIRGTTLSVDVVLPVTNVDDPTTGSIAVAGAPHVGNALSVDISGLVDPDGTPGFTATWYRVGSNQILSGGTHFTPREAGTYEVRIEAFSPGLFPRTTHTFTAQVTVSEPPVPTAPVLNEVLRIYENHPNDKPVYDAMGDGAFTLTAGYGDNAMFRVTTDGRILFAPNAEHTRLDYEKPADRNGDNVYELQLVRSHGAGQTQTINLTVTVQDLAYEQLSFSNDRDAFYHSFFHLRPRDLRPEDIPDRDVQQLIIDPVWHMPKSGPLTLTYSLIIPSESSLSFLTTPERIADVRHSIRLALDEFERAANLKFIEVDETQDTRGDIRFFVGSGKAGFGKSTGPSVSLNVISGVPLRNGSIVDFGANPSTNPSYFYATIVHEIGHTMGLGHPFHDSIHGGWTGNSRLLETPSTVMSYSRDKDGYIDGALTPLDIRALQFLYGRPGTNFDGVESRLITPYRVFHVTQDRNAIIMDETANNADPLASRLVTFTLVGDNGQPISFGSQRLTVTSPNADMFELRQNADGTISLWLRAGQQLDFETTTNGQILVRFGLESPQGKVLLHPLYFLLDLRDVDETPSAMDLSSGRLDTTLPETRPTTAQKLADITFTDDALGTNRPVLRENPGGLFELKQDSSGDWSLWLKGGVAAPDFETLRKVGETRTTTIEAVIGSDSSGIGDEPAQQRYEVTIRNVAEFTPGSHADIIGDARVGQTLHADTSGIGSGDGELSFTYEWSHRFAGGLLRTLSNKESFEPPSPGRYILTITARAGGFEKDYTKFFRVEPATQSAGSRGEVVEGPAESFDDGLNDPWQDDLQPQQMDMV